MNKLLTATIKATGKRVEVYRHRSGSFIDFSDCNTEYQKSELKL